MQSAFTLKAGQRPPNAVAPELREHDGALHNSADQFPAILRWRLDAYFVHQDLSPKADALMVAKIVLGLAALFGTYAALYLFPLSSPGFFLLYILHGVTHVFLLLNVAHDSNHNAISRNVYVNRILSHVFDICGVNSYVWRIVHHQGHHSCMNIHGQDEAISGRKLMFRFSSHAPRIAIHRYQHVYALFLYSLFSLDYVFFKDFEYLFFPGLRTLRRPRHPLREIATLFAGKIFYLTYMLILPVVVLGRSPLLIGLSFLVAHLIAGLTMVIVFQTSHAVAESRFPETRDEFSHYVYHVLATTADYATRSPAVTFLTGGLNHHVAHHLCPHVAHTHYPQLTRIIRETATEFHAQYREHASMREALSHHLVLLKRLGCCES